MKGRFTFLIFILLVSRPFCENLSKSKLGIHLIGKYTENARRIINSGVRIIKVLDPHINEDMRKAIREYKKSFPEGLVVVRIWDKTPFIRFTLKDNPEKSADLFWTEILKPALDKLSEERRMIDYVEGPNEGENTPTWETLETAKWFGKFWEKLAINIYSGGFLPCAGSIAVGNPTGTIEEIRLKIEAFIPALRVIKKLNGAWSYHSYSLEYSTDENIEKWYSLRYRIFYEFLKEKYPELSDLPMILTEGGIDRGGNPKTDGYLARGDMEKFIRYLQWFDNEIRRDNYIIGVTLFQIGDSENWTSFNLEPIALYLSDYLKRNK